MNVPIIVAIVALVSTTLGAVIGAATTYTLAVRRERADKEIDIRRHALEVKRAARVLDAELLWVRAAASYWIETKTWSEQSTPLLSLSSDARQQYLDTIAPDLTDQEWRHLVVAFHSAEQIRVTAASPIDRSVPISSDMAELFIPLLSNVDKGRNSLAPYEFDLQATPSSKS